MKRLLVPIVLLVASTFFTAFPHAADPSMQGCREVEQVWETEPTAAAGTFLHNPETGLVEYLPRDENSEAQVTLALGELDLATTHDVYISVRTGGSSGPFLFSIDAHPVVEEHGIFRRVDPESEASLFWQIEAAATPTLTVEFDGSERSKNWFFAGEVMICSGT